MKTIRTFQAFAGYDSQLMAMRRIERDFGRVKFDCVGWSEIDKYAVKAHDALFPELKSLNYGDISKIAWDEVRDFDLFTYSFPCQSISTAGNMDGLTPGSGTKSSLLWECEKAITCKKPKWLIMENVPALLAECFKDEFDKWKNKLARMGYTNYVQKLNAKDYGVPQSRERVFMVSVMYGCWAFHFPAKERLGKFMYELLEKYVDRKYYLSEKRIQGMIKQMKTQKYKGRSFKFNPKGRNCDISYCITTKEGDVKTSNYVIESDGIRKLTERECFRLMDVSEADIEILTGGGISRTQLRKLAGNSIVVNVFYHVLRKLFVDKDSDSGQYELKFE